MNQYESLTLKMPSSAIIARPTPSSNNQWSLWSPFSAPSISPLCADTAQSPQFQYAASSQLYVDFFQLYAMTNHKQNSTASAPILAARSGNKLTYKQAVQKPATAVKRQQSEEKKMLPKRSDQVDMSELVRAAAIQKANGGRAKSCTFCKTNGEREEIYTSHSLKDANDRITCPILALYSCPICGASGEQTHTKKYCPVLQKNIRNEMLNKLKVKGN